MEAIVERCCGLDVHQASVVACILVEEGRRKPRREVRTFGTTTNELEKLAAWLQAQGCTHVAMESTGVYWMPVYTVLEGKFELVVGNAQHIEQVPGRKTDVSDSQWLAQLLRCGLIRPSFIPPKPLRELRDLLRYRRKLVRSRSAERNRLQKLLETANIKLASVMSDVFGASGKAMLQAIVADERSNEEIADLARGALRHKRPALLDALDGRLEAHHRFMLQTQLVRLDELDGHIATLEQRIEEKLTPYREQHTRLMQIPGVSWVVAATIIAELGVDMSAFGSAGACAAWVGVCPGNHESAGKRKKVRAREGNEHLTTTLVEAAQAAARTKRTYLRDKFYRLKARIGYSKAIVALAHKILIAVYHMLQTGADYRELGETYLDQRDQKRLAQRLVRRLEGLGYDVRLAEREAAVFAVSAEAAARPPAASVQRSSCTSPAPATRARRMPSPAPSQPAQAPSQADAAAVCPAAPSPSARGAIDPSAVQAPAAGSPTPRVVTAPQAPAPNTTARPPSTPAPRGARRSHARPAAGSKPASTTAPPQSRLRSDAASRRDPRLPPVGHILRRSYQGVEHHVLIREDGFAYRGQLYSSLSRIAKVITGATWNGFRFFVRPFVFLAWELCQPRVSDHAAGPPSPTLSDGGTTKKSRHIACHFQGSDAEHQYDASQIACPLRDQIN